jgi:phosphoribosylglycinamide formyltransferase-1
MTTKKIAVFFSGAGTNLENLFLKIHNKTFNDIKIQIALAFCDRNNAAGIEKSRKYGVEPIIIDPKKHLAEEAFEKKVVEIAKEHEIELCVLAGFMRILSPHFTKNLKAINIHPTLLPLFKGANALRRSFDAGTKVAGASVHFVNDELDGGEIILQKSFLRTAGMSYEEFAANIRKIEYEILPEAIAKILTDRANA